MDSRLIGKGTKVKVDRQDDLGTEWGYQLFNPDGSEIPPLRPDALEE